jgi:hypothetical protein
MASAGMPENLRDAYAFDLSSVVMILHHDNPEIS